jgi:acetyl-CoA carboxylase carboxyltransferase component
MGGARMHCTVSGCGDVLVADEDAGIVAARRYLEYLPQSWHDAPPVAATLDVAAGSEDITDVIPAEASKGYDVMAFIRGIIDDGSFFEIKRLFAREIVCGFARINGPLLFLADVPGFMIGTAVERQGIIRHGAKMIAALAQAQVPRISVILRKAYGAGLYAMSGPAFEPDCTLALPTAQIAVMGPEAAINAVFYNKIQDTPEDDRAAFVKGLEDEYRDDIDIVRLASELVVDAIVPPAELRVELVRRFAAYRSRRRADVSRHHRVAPV